MKHFLLSLLLTPLAVWAQTDKVQQSPLAPDAASPRCKVVYPQHEAALRAMKLQARPLGEPSTLPSGESTVQIADNGKEYVYRLALCVSPYYTHQYYGGDKAKVREWVKEAGEYLNTVYQRDLGIRFEIVEDDRLILTDYPADYPESKFTNDYGTKIINALIGTEAYDCGILIRPTTSQVDGMAAFGGAYYTTDKGNAMCNTNFPIIAHELGHMFGAQHSHEMVGGQCVEPGKGESIMSYGENKQTFALASIIPIRRHANHAVLPRQQARPQYHCGLCKQSRQHSVCGGFNTHQTCAEPQTNTQKLHGDEKYAFPVQHSRRKRSVFVYLWCAELRCGRLELPDQCFAAHLSACGQPQCDVPALL